MADERHHNAEHPPAHRSIWKSIEGADNPFAGAEGDDARREGDGVVDDDCPVIALGFDENNFYFSNPVGLPVSQSGRLLCSVSGILSLLLGDDTWARRVAPRRKTVTDEHGNETEAIIGFNASAVGARLMRACRDAGVMRSRLVFRQPGMWRYENDPVAHCGDGVMIGGRWHKPGARTGAQVWAASEATARPGIPCAASVGREPQQDLQTYWSFREPAAAIALLGLVATGYLGAALDWRCNGFITGPTGSGKSSLRRVMRNLWPLHSYVNDASKAGIEQAIAGRAIPAVIDEANDRHRSAGRDLVDLVLSASGDEGTKLARGTVDGKGRTAEIVSNVVMFSINAPELEPQHFNRFVMIELENAAPGTDFRAQHSEVAEKAARHACELWGRAIAAWDRYRRCLSMFRSALGERGCGPREMDSKGSLLAGWWVLTREGVTDAGDAREGVAALGNFIVTAKAAQDDDAPARVLRHLLSSNVILSRSTERDPIGVLLDLAFGVGDDDHQPSYAARMLANYGIRPVRECLRAKAWQPEKQCYCPNCYDDRRKAPAPRLGPGNQLWIANRHPELAKIFAGTEFDHGRWRQELARVDGAVSSGRTIRIGGAAGHAIWLPDAALQRDASP